MLRQRRLLDETDLLRRRMRRIAALRTRLSQMLKAKLKTMPFSLRAGRGQKLKSCGIFAEHGGCCRDAGEPLWSTLNQEFEVFP